MQKGVYPYECMDGWEKFDETSVPVKEDLYNSLNMERHIADADYNHAKRVRKERGIKNVCEYLDVYIQSNTLLLADAFENLMLLMMEKDI